MMVVKCLEDLVRSEVPPHYGLREAISVYLPHSLFLNIKSQ